MWSAIFFRITLIGSTRSPTCGLGGGGAAISWAAGAAADAGARSAGRAAGAAVAPDSIKLNMSFLVTRPLMPVPSSLEMSTPCSWAIFRTSGLDFVLRKSAAVGSGCVSTAGAGDAGAGGGAGDAAGGGGGGSGVGGGGAGGGGGSDTDDADGAAADELPSSTATTVFTSTVSPSLNLTSV